MKCKLAQPFISVYYIMGLLTVVLLCLNSTFL